MFKKHESEEAQIKRTAQGTEQQPPEQHPPANVRGRTQTTIGPTIEIHGDVRVNGTQNVHIEGRVEGTISLNDNILSVGKEGQINATINARAIFVGGKVEGDLNGDEQVVIHGSGNVRGNIAAPRVTLEDGCKFKGSIDMDGKPSAALRTKNDSRSEPAPEFKLATELSAASRNALEKTPRQRP
jgi:cytoskeletal protein CcmA (bactofilin family)